MVIKVFLPDQYLYYTTKIITITITLGVAVQVGVAVGVVVGVVVVIKKERKADQKHFIKNIYLFSFFNFLDITI